MPDWKEELARVEVELKHAETERHQAETRLDNALNHLAEVQADQAERMKILDQRERKARHAFAVAIQEGLAAYLRELDDEDEDGEGE